MLSSKMLNIGCGTTYHQDWINIDVSPSDSNVLAVDISNGLPFPSNALTVCYSSHVLEHLNKTSARNLIMECFRTLKHEGVIRLVLPDLEAITREYLSVLTAVTSGESERDLDYDWIMLELYDQVARNFTGGEMALFLQELGADSRDFVRLRIGAAAEEFWKPKQALSNQHRINTLLKRANWRTLFKLLRENIAGYLVYLIAGKSTFKSFKIGIFRSSGEVHQWMYDRYSLKRLLEEVGFTNVKVCAANESRIPEFGKYSLDVLGGNVRKPDSLFVEATKP